jgi:NAD(P)-dependent dehydrogenase (short-subunit alcohol dehydrogenase family)
MILRHCGRIRPSRSQQSPGEGIGNGRATVLRFAQEGAKILAVDRDLVSAEETAVLAAESGGECVAVQADVTREGTLAAAMATAVERWGRIDILHNNVGVSIAGGDRRNFTLTLGSGPNVRVINLSAPENPGLSYQRY